MSDYDTDLMIWSEHQAALMRSFAAGQPVNEAPDWPNIAEEIESLGKSDRRELRNRIATILFHLIKLQASPSEAPRAGWHDTISEQRDGLDNLLSDSPSLRGEIADMVSHALPKARIRALASLADHGEQPRVDVAEVSFTEDQVLGPWLPV